MRLLGFIGVVMLAIAAVTLVRVGLGWDHFTSRDMPWTVLAGTVGGFASWLVDRRKSRRLAAR
ncbi:hypothetical protein [Singulisphaera sp. PoT]|uniref:hypothetical protein n=1 Tax=Singulisphaera sp. PoT TaxID=3411797 RepID=UPI003BF5DE0F